MKITEGQYSRRKTAILATLFATAAFPFFAGAATINVAQDTVTVDALDGLCSIREAFENANADAVIHSDCNGGDGEDTVALFPVSTYLFTDSYPPGSENALPVVSGFLTVLGNGSVLRRSSAGAIPPFRFIEAGTAEIEIRNLTFDNGLFDSTFPGAFLRGGGAVLIQGGQLDVFYCDFLANTIDVGRGGAILARNTEVVLNDSRFLNNQALVTALSDGGGGLALVDGSLLAERCAFVGNNADGAPGNQTSGGVGGGLLIEGTTATGAAFDLVATITHSTISSNAANSSGGIALVAQSGPDAEVLLALDYVTLVRNDGSVLVDGIGFLGNDQAAFAVYSNSVIHSNGNLLPDGTSVGIDCQVNVYNAFISGFRNLLDSDGECQADFFDDTTTDRLAPDLAVDVIVDFHQPVPGGLLVDHASGGSCTPGATFDQLGKVRGNGSGSGGASCDIGAVEDYSAPTFPIFSDGFELGDTLMWSDSMP